MKKAILTALIISIMLIGCAIVEGSGSNSAEIDQAQQESVLKAYQSSETSPKNKGLSLPEEINMAESGDLLKVERVTKDSIFLGFAQK